MNFRQILSHRLFVFLSSFKRELFLILILLISLSTGFTGSFAIPDTTKEYMVWETRGPKQVEIDTGDVLSEQITELEIVPIKYERPKTTPIPSTSVKPRGESRQIDEHTWTMEIENDSVMATHSEIVAALNSYRLKRGIGILSYDSGLTQYAQGRADFFAGQGGMDGHSGFQDFISNQDGFNKLGFYSLGENSSFGYHLEGINLIEGVFAGDAPHDSNQLNPEWTHVGVGVNGVAVNIIFGGKKQ